jgi:hypothetical protein
MNTDNEDIQGKNEELKGRAQKNYENTLLKISEEGILFRSYRDGHRVLLTPEASVQCQKVISILLFFRPHFFAE